MMTIRTKYAHLLEELGGILEAPVTPATELATVEAWDSMTAVMIVAMIDDVTGIAVSGEKVASCTTVGELLDLAGVTP